MKKIGLDIDGVLCNFSQGAIERAKEMGFEAHFPESYSEVSYWGISDYFAEVMKDAWLDRDFWLNLKPLPYTNPMDFNPDCYITSRPIESDVTSLWLSNYGFPEAPVFTVSNHENKLIHIKDRELDLFVDDRHDTVIHLIENGVNAVLYKAPYHVSHIYEIAGIPLINHLSEVRDLRI